MRRRFDLHHGGDAAQPGRHCSGNHSRNSQGSIASPGAGVRGRRRLSRSPFTRRRRGTCAVHSCGGRLDPQRKQQDGRILGRLRHRSANRPTDHHLPLDRPVAPHAWAVVACGTCATYGGIHAWQGNPTGCRGLADYLGWDWQSPSGIPLICVPGCPVQPDNFMEVVLYLLNQAAGRAP